MRRFFDDVRENELYEVIRTLQRLWCRRRGAKAVMSTQDDNAKGLALLEEWKSGNPVWRRFGVVCGNRWWSVQVWTEQGLWYAAEKMIRPTLLEAATKAIEAYTGRKRE